VIEGVREVGFLVKRNFRICYSLFLFESALSGLPKIRTTFLPNSKAIAVPSATPMETPKAISKFSKILPAAAPNAAPNPAPYTMIDSLFMFLLYFFPSMMLSFAN
jgi:hypothetical protein